MIFHDSKSSDKPSAARRGGFWGAVDSIGNKVDGWQYSYLAWCFFLPFVIMLFLDIAMKVFPFGESSVLVLDLNGQYVHFFEALRDWVYGEGSLLYSFGRSLGGEFMGIYAYYLASPLSYIVALFPKHMMLEALMVMFLIKCGLCGLTFGYYLHCSRHSTRIATVVFSVLYALMMYCIAYQHNTMWIDNVILLPLVTLGIERLIKYKRFGLFSVSLALALLSSFYIGYMTCIYVAIYFFYYYFAQDASGENNPLREKAHFLKSLVRIVLYSVIAVGIAAMILLPAAYSLGFGKSTFTNPDFSFRQNFSFIELFAKMLPSSYDTVYVTGLPFVYCGMLALILLPLYFLAKKISWQEKVASGFILIVFILSMNIHTLDMVWHGFQAPNWLNYRYSFMFCFLVLVMGSKALAHIREIGIRPIVIVSSGLAMMLIIIQKLDLTNTKNNSVTVHYISDLGTIWLALACIVLYSLILMAATSKKCPRFVATILVVLVCGEVFLSGWSTFKMLNSDVVISSYASYHDFYDRYQDTVDYIKENDTDFYRMEKLEFRNSNDAMALGFRGLSNSTSTLNKDTLAFLRSIGLLAPSHYSKYQGSTPVTDSLFGVKYLLAENAKSVSDLYSLFASTDEINAYSNPYALPIAFISANDIKNVSLSGISPHSGETYNTPFTRMNAIISALLGNSTLRVYNLIDNCTIETEGETAEPYSIAGHTHYKASKLTFTTTATSTGEVYFYLPSDYTRNATVAVNGKTLATYTVSSSEIVNLGTYTAGDTIVVTVTLSSNEYYLMEDEAYFATVNKANLILAMTSLQGGRIELSDYSERYFEGTVTSSNGKTTVFTTIPYDSGWQVTIDGKKVDTYETLGALLAFDVTDGEHTVVMKYMPSAFVRGVTITILSCVLLACLIALTYLIRIKKLKVKNRKIASALNAILPTEDTHTDEQEFSSDENDDDINGLVK